MKLRHWLKILMLSSCCILLAGCLQLDLRIVVNEDGSATIYERIRFSRQLIDLAGDRKEELLKLLSKETALDRMKHMGEGVTLVSHELRDADGASKEAMLVYKVDDLNHLQYVSPWFAYPDFADNSTVKFKFEPLYKSRAYRGGRAGEMCVSLEQVKKPVEEARLPENAPPPAGPSPLENQVYRDLTPLFRDMLKDVRIKMTLESYAPITASGLPLRNRRARPKSIDFINFSDKDMDAAGSALLSNEEVMLDLARWRFSSPTIAALTKESETNQTLPAFTPRGSRFMWFTGSSTVSFKPSRQLFDKYFEGKMLDYSEWQASPPDKHLMAKFEDPDSSN
jgi:hypothetical protein